MQAAGPGKRLLPEVFWPFPPAGPESAAEFITGRCHEHISMEKQSILATGRLLLRPYTLADARAVQRLCGDYAVAATTLLPHPYPDGLAEAWIASLREGIERGDAAAFAVTLAGEGTLIGGVRLRIDPAHARGELGFWVAKHCWGRGYGTEAVRAVIEYGFSVIGLHRVHAMHFSRNPASGRVMEKCGMVHEGRFREHVRKWGVYEDVDIWGVLREPSVRHGVEASSPPVRAPL
jgi:ribosomal-protein-alanine N-acetyltransferase